MDSSKATHNMTCYHFDIRIRVPDDAVEAATLFMTDPIFHTCISYAARAAERPVGELLGNDGPNYIRVPSTPTIGPTSASDFDGLVGSIEHIEISDETVSQQT